MSTETGDVSGGRASATLEIGLLGYGEVGRILAEELRLAGVGSLRAFDIKVGTPAERTLRQHADEHEVVLTESVDGLAGSDLIISAVTASQTVEAASACAVHVRDMWYLDLNSASPSSKVQAAELVERVNGRYVEAAVMAAVPARRLAVPMILGGRHAKRLAPVLTQLGFNVTATSDTLGMASATKLCRSVMIKGLEALTLECYSAARAWGVEEDVLRSLKVTFPGLDFEKQGSYFFSRTMQHGKRRAEEMREAAKTLDEVAVPAWMTGASAEWQDWMAKRTRDCGLEATIEPGRWRGIVDVLFKAGAAKDD